MFPVWLTILPFTASVLWEAPGRTEETVLYVIPKFMDFTWNYFTKKKLARDVPGFLQTVFAVSIGSVCSYYISDVIFFFWDSLGKKLERQYEE